jgi:hypothetical protein
MGGGKMRGSDVQSEQSADALSSRSYSALWIVYRVTEDKRCEGGQRMQAIGWVRAPIWEEALALARTKFAPKGFDLYLSVEEMEGDWGWFV